MMPYRTLPRREEFETDGEYMHFLGALAITNIDAYAKFLDEKRIRNQFGAPKKSKKRSNIDDDRTEK